jgi:uncharacterized membrane protein YqhA
MKATTRLIESVMFGSRWLLVPFLLGLIAGLAASSSRRCTPRSPRTY